MLNKKKICNSCNTEQFIWKNFEGNKYCLGCWNKIKPQAVQSSKPRKAINKVSNKRKLEQKEYSSERILFLSKNPVCKGKIYGICTHDATEVHHACGRVGSLYLDQSNWIGLCHSCHVYVENNPEVAKELGLSKSRL